MPSCNVCTLPDSAPRALHDLMHFVVGVRPRWIRVDRDVFEALAAQGGVQFPGRRLQMWLGRGRTCLVEVR